MQAAVGGQLSVGKGEAAAQPGHLAIAREGVTAGVLGVGAVAIWFLVTDTLAGRPFYTPATLGARFFQGTGAEPLFPAIDWFAVLIGNLIAVASMVGYFWLQHPQLLKKLLRG
jgi:fatty acid desaturase